MLTVISCKSSNLPQASFEGRHETVVAIPYISPDRVARVAAVLQRRTDRDALLVLAEDDLRQGFIKTANMVFARTDSAYFCYLAEDVFPGHFWLEYALNPMKKTGAGLLAFSDGSFFGSVAAFGMVKREWVTTLYPEKCLFYPGYTSHCADTELSVIAERTRNLIFNPNALMVEVDYEKHLKRHNADDEALYARRHANCFDGLIPFPPPPL